MVFNLQIGKPRYLFLLTAVVIGPYRYNMCIAALARIFAPTPDPPSHVDNYPAKLTVLDTLYGFNEEVRIGIMCIECKQSMYGPEADKFAVKQMKLQNDWPGWQGTCYSKAMQVLGILSWNRFYLIQKCETELWLHFFGKKKVGLSLSIYIWLQSFNRISFINIGMFSTIINFTLSYFLNWDHLFFKITSNSVKLL